MNRFCAIAIIFTFFGLGVGATEAESEQEQLSRLLITAPDYHKFRFENQYVRVLQVVS